MQQTAADSHPIAMSKKSYDVDDPFEMLFTKDGWIEIRISHESETQWIASDTAMEVEE